MSAQYQFDGISCKEAECVVTGAEPEVAVLYALHMSLEERDALFRGREESIAIGATELL